MTLDLGLDGEGTDGGRATSPGRPHARGGPDREQRESKHDNREGDPPVAQARASRRLGRSFPVLARPDRFSREVRSLRPPRVELGAERVHRALGGMHVAVDRKAFVLLPPLDGPDAAAQVGRELLPGVQPVCGVRRSRSVVARPSFVAHLGGASMSEVHEPRQLARHIAPRSRLARPDASWRLGGMPLVWDTVPDAATVSAWPRVPWQLTEAQRRVARSDLAVPSRTLDQEP